LDLIVAVLFQLIYVISNLALISLGLAIIFGMMRVINLAHGEFLMLGGYTVVVATNAGINIWISMLILAPLIVGVIGVVVERLLIRWLYGRMVDTLLATWGLSLLLVGIVTSLFGASTGTTVSPPLGVLRIGEYSASGYEFFSNYCDHIVVVWSLVDAAFHQTRSASARYDAKRRNGFGAWGFDQ